MPRIIDAFAQFFDDNGDPLVNGYLKFFESGTNNTTKNTYADINETIANANPVPLTAAGRCPNVFGTGTYNVISYTSDMVQIQQFDPVNVSDAAGQFSSWDSVTIYNIGDLVIGSDDAYYRSLINNNENQDPTISPGQWEQVKFVGVWNINVTYSQGDVVYGSDGVSYLSKTDTNLNNDPVTDTTNWKNSSIPIWITDATYLSGNIVFGSDGFLYSSNIDANMGNDPVSDTANWTIVVTDKIQSVTATVAANALTVALNPTNLDFRNTTLTDGTTVNRPSDTVLSLIVPSGATLGTIDGVEARLLLIAIDNAGVVELAIANEAGNSGLNEEGVISTTAIDATADLDSVIYSTSARTDVAYRIVGAVDITEATAGTWATGPTLVVGSSRRSVTPTASQGASMVLIETATASASAFIEFSSGIDATYDKYVVTMTNVKPVASSSFYMGFLKSGVLDANAVHFWTQKAFLDNGTETLSVGASDTKFSLVGNANSATAAASISGEVSFFSPDDTTYYKQYAARIINQNGANRTEDITAGGNHRAATAIDGIRFYMSTGNISVGAFRLYGIKDA